MDYQRIPPNSIEAEQAVIGAALVYKEVLPNIFDSLTPDDFYIEKHKEIMRCISEMFVIGEHIDIVTVSDVLRKRGVLEKMGGFDGLGELTSKAALPESVKHYTSIIFEKSLLRQTISVTADIQDKAYSEADLINIKEVTENFLQNLDGRTEKQSSNIKNSVEQAKQALGERIKQGGAIPGIQSGFRFFDYITGGLIPSLLYVVAARPSMGKTSFLLCVISHVAGVLKKPVLFFSLEMSTAQILDRLVSIRTGIPLQNLKIGRVTPDEQSRIDGAFQHISEWPLIIDDRPGLTLQEVNSRSRQAALKYKDLGLICLDHLTEIKHHAKDDRSGITENVRGCKRLAKQLKTPFILLCQLNRGVEGRENKRPVLSDLRETGAIEETADCVGFLYRESYYIETADKSEAELNILKNRDGETKGIKLHWNGSTTCFSTPERPF